MSKIGYIQTEIGLIPEDWEVKMLGEVCSYINDGVHKTPNYIDNGIPFYSVENVSANNFEDVKFISEEEHLIFSKRCMPEKGDILLTRIGTLGLTKLIDWEVNASIYVSLALLKINRKEIEPRYLYAYSKSIFFVNNIKKLALTNATPQKIYMGEISKVPLLIPKSKKEQTAIAQVLSDTDALIDGLKALIAKKQAIKQGAMQELLTGKTRLKDENGKTFEGEWEEKMLGEMCFLQSGYSFQSALFKDGGIPIFRIANIKNSKISFENVAYYDENFPISEDFWVRCGDILIAMSGATTGKVGRYNYEHKAYLNQRVGNFKILNNAQLNKDYLFQLVNSNLFRNLLEKELEQGAQPNISAKQIENLIFQFPNYLKEQTAIAQVLSDMDAEIELLEARLQKTEQLKQGMMQELLTGRTRLDLSRFGYQSQDEVWGMAAEDGEEYNRK